MSVIDFENAKTESPFPPVTERPQYVVLDGWREHEGRKHKPGVYYCGVKNPSDDSPPQIINAWICTPLHVDAITHDEHGNNFGRLLRFKPTRGNWRSWAMPMDMLAGSGEALRAELFSMGVEIDPHEGRRTLSTYLQSKHPEKTVRSAIQVGWCGDSFVLPDAVIPESTDVIFQSGERIHDEHTRVGDVDGWRKLSALAIDNPLLQFALSTAFTGPLLKRCHAESGGVHFVGDSSTGKTTLLDAACSVWGGENYRRSWRATANGMEGAAAMFNDCLLALDEISECDPREVGAIVYQLGNGRGKQRAGRSGKARSVTRWRCFILSSGERTIETAMREGGRRTKAGQAVRMLDIPASREYGAWDELHGFDTGAAMSDAIKTIAKQHHGHAGREFLTRLTADSRDFAEYLERIKAAFQTDDSGQHKRAAARFALVALAGELATEYGITSWAEGDALKAAIECFSLWLSTRTKGNDEQRQILEAVSAFIDKHGDSRFSSVDDSNATVRDRAGWWEKTSEGITYLFNADGMREAVKGFDFKRALDVLQAVGAIPPPGADGKRGQAQRIGGRLVRVYSVNPEKLGAGHES